jgi:hypothetical protein
MGRLSWEEKEVSWCQVGWGSGMEGFGCTGGRHCGYAGVASRAKRRRGRDCDVLASLSESVRQAVKLTSGRVHIETLDSLNPMSSSRLLDLDRCGGTAFVEQRRPSTARVRIDAESSVGSEWRYE